MRTSVFAAVLGAGLVSAQTLSSGCQQTLAEIAASSEYDCLNAGALASLAIGGSNTSVVDPINNWLSGLCSQAACSNDTISNAVSNVTSGCSSDLSNAGFSLPSDALSSVIGIVQQVYPVARQALCLKDTSASTNCITQTLTNIQNTYGPLTISSIPSVASTLAGSLSALPANITCTDCNKQILNIANTAYPDVMKGIMGEASQLCGADFTNGAAATDIQETASNATASSSSKSTSAAFPLASLGKAGGAALSGLLAVSVAFAFMA
ncbi:hypothetical protein PLICRDRAFT_88909 [Plicaturopsis crispa FD-325 SS-3]|nr:hypothetical protein PLICRDRAFT_88909 [Plicaturopsis crispa FD-325 SS-3]